MAQPKGDLIRVNNYVAAGVIKIGDFVTINASGEVAVAAASQALLGVAIGYAGAAGREISVADHPDQEYLVAKSSTTPSSQTDYFQNYNIVASASSGYESAHKLDSSSGATTATLPLRAIAPSRLQVPALAPNMCVVRINNHVEKAGVAGV